MTLVVPVRDERESIEALLASVAAQRRAPDAVVLVDAGSRDGTADRVRALTAGADQVRILDAGPATPGRARNLGITSAATEWVALTDAGIRLHPDWLYELERAALACGRECDVVYGHYEPAIRTRFEEHAALAYVPAPIATPAGRLRGPTVVSCLLRRAAWEQAGGFPDLRSGEDNAFIEALARAGARMAWAPRARVVWSMQPTLGRTFRRFRTYAYHGARAGRQRTWHHGVARIYLLAVAGVALSAVYRRLALVLPLAAAVRVARLTTTRRDGHSLAWALHPRRLAGVGVVVAVIDAALFVGWGQAVWAKRVRLRRPRTSSSGRARAGR